MGDAGATDVMQTVCAWLILTFYMMTSSNGNDFRVTVPLCGEFTALRWFPNTKASDAEPWCFFNLGPNKRLSKQSWGWWFETPSRSLWRHCHACEDRGSLSLTEINQAITECMACLIKFYHQWAGCNYSSNFHGGLVEPQLLAITAAINIIPVWDRGISCQKT